jgi:hypothetical protein
MGKSYRKTETERAAERAQKAEWLAVAQQQQAYKNNGSGDFLPDSRTYERGVINQGGEGAYLAPVDFGRDSGRTRDFDTLEQVPQPVADGPVLTALDDIESTEMTKSYYDNLGKINQLSAHAAANGFNITKPNPMNKEQMELSTIYGKMVANNKLMGNTLKSGYEAVTEGSKEGNVFTKGRYTSTRADFVHSQDMYNNMVTTLAGDLTQLDRQGDVDAANARIQEGRDYLTGEYERLNDIGDFEGAKLAQRAMMSLDDVATNRKGEELDLKRQKLEEEKKKNRFKIGSGDNNLNALKGLQTDFWKMVKHRDTSALSPYYNVTMGEDANGKPILKITTKENMKGKGIPDAAEISLDDMDTGYDQFVGLMLAANKSFYKGLEHSMVGQMSPMSEYIPYPKDNWYINSLGERVEKTGQTEESESGWGGFMNDTKISDENLSDMQDIVTSLGGLLVDSKKPDNPVVGIRRGDGNTEHNESFYLEYEDKTTSEPYDMSTDVGKKKWKSLFDFAKTNNNKPLNDRLSIIKEKVEKEQAIEKQAFIDAGGLESNFKPSPSVLDVLPFQSNEAMKIEEGQVPTGDRIFFFDEDDKISWKERGDRGGSFSYSESSSSKKPVENSVTPKKITLGGIIANQQKKE